MPHHATGKTRSGKSAQRQQGKEQHLAAKHASPTAVQPTAPVGRRGASLAATRLEEQRELLKRNVTEGWEEPHPDLPAGIHATGSFTRKQR